MSVMKTSGRMLLHDAQGFVAGAGAGDDLDVVFHFEQGGERAEDHGLIFGDDYADLVAVGGGHALSFAEQRRHWGERQMDNQAGSSGGLALERAAEGFEPFAHAAQAVAFGAVGAASVVGDFQRAERFVAFEADHAASGLGVAHDIGDGLAQGQRQHRFLCRAERNLRGFAVHGDAGGFQCGAGAGQFGERCRRCGIRGWLRARRPARRARSCSTSCISCLARSGSRSTSLRASSDFSVMSESVWPSTSCRSRAMRSRSATLARCSISSLGKPQLLPAHSARAPSDGCQNPTRTISSSIEPQKPTSAVAGGSA